MVETRDIEDVYPLSPLQEGLLFHTLEPGQGGLYAAQLTCRLRGLDVQAFERAWRTVVNRHPSLRSAFVWKSTQRPMQVVARKVGLPFRHEDWRGLGPAEIEARLRVFLAEDRSRELQPSRAPLMRLALFRTGEDTYQLVWTSHHLILDGWCRSPILGEVFTLYEVYAQGRDAELPPMRPYRDYIAWLQAQDLAEVETFWRSKLRGVVERTPVHALPAGRDEGTGEQEVALSAAAASALRSLAQRHRLTPGTIVHGAWALLLFRYSGWRDVVFGTVVSGRPPSLEGAASIVGLFANTLPVRVRGEDAVSAADWLRSVQEELVDQRQYEHSPLAQVQKWSELGSGQPLFDTLVVFQNYPGDEVLARLVRGLGIEDTRFFEQASYPLTLVVIPGAVWRLQLGYDRRRFSDAAVARMLDHYRRLLEGLATDAERRLPDLALLEESERAQLLQEWNDTDAPSALRHPPVHKLIAARAAAEPESQAIVWDGGSWSYRTLDRRANQLARHLRLLGVRPESVVAVLAADRSPELPLGILGALKAGGAFLALDSSYPRERLAYMLTDAGCRVLLTQGEEVEPLAVDGVRRIALDRDWEEIARQSEEAPDAAVDAAHLAYVFYTSGSTGRPKGVAVSHGAFLSFAGEMARRLRLTAADRMLQFASPAFDVLVEELFPVWLHGGAVVLQPPETLGSPRSLGAAMERLGVTVAELPAVYWHQWVDELASGAAVLPRSLRLLLLGAEKPSPERLAEWRRFAVPLVYVFGLTETAVTSTLFEVPAEHVGELPIGRPVANTRLYVLDRDGQPAPVGVPGELFIGGEGVARGYLGRPELTAERFVPDPWSAQMGARLYRTGDLARFRLDGNLDFLGRIDDQVKVRGVRIEPGEIEASLRQHPGVREAVVIVREDRPGDRRLVGYFLAAERPVSARELRAFLAERLPDHLVPSALIELAALPVTPSGKVDRRSLPAPEPCTAAAEDRFAEPRTETERLLADIWQGVLGIERAGIHDNFFELGGDSILSIRVASAAHRRGYELAPWQLFQHSTIAGLAQLLAERRGALPADEPAPAGPIPLTPIQHWFFERSLPEPEHWNMPVLLEPREPVAPGFLETVLARLVERHDALRLRFLRQGDGWCQEAVASVGPPPLHRIDLSALAEEPRRRALEEAAGRLQRGLDLAAAPLLRAAWLDLGAAGTRLLLVAHHLVVDGVSWHILADDLETGYLQLLRGETLDLPPATAPFARWAERLAAHARSGAFDGELAEWRSLLAELPVPLPVDFADGVRSEAAARNLTVSLGADETRNLLQEVPRAYRAQVNDLLVTALLRAFRGWTGGRRLLVDLEGHGREELLAGVDLSRTVGWFTTLTPLPLELPEAGEPGEDLQSVKEQLRAVAGRGIEYGLLRYLLGEAATDLRSAFRPEVLFNYMGQIGAPAARPALFALADEPIGPPVSPRGERSHLLEVNAQVQDGRLEVRWTWSEGVHRRATIAALADSFAAHLRTLVAHCLSSGERGYAPSDFPLAAVDAAALERLASAAGGEIDDLYPLSPLQKGMLFHSLFEPGEGAYVAQIVFELGGGVDTGALQEAWREVLARQPVLRTAFFWEGLDEPLQAVARRVGLPWREEDLRNLAGGEQDAWLQSHLEADRARGFDAACAPLLRLLLLRREPAPSWLVLSLHQVVLDGWSLPLLLEDLFVLYEALLHGRDVRLVPRRPFRDYIAWLQRQEAGRAEAFWRSALDGYAGPAQLGPEEIGPAASSAAGYGELQAELPAHVVAGLLALARAQRVTLNTVTQMAWALLLSRYSGEEDVVFGSVVSGRPPDLPGVEEMIGLLINTLPVRVRVPETSHLSEGLRALKDRQAEMHRYEHTPLLDVQKWSGVPVGRPLFKSLLVFQNYPADAAFGERAAAIGIRKLLSSEQTSYPLTLVARPGAGLTLALSHSPRRFAAPPVQRMLGHLQALLESFAEGADPLVCELSLLRPSERHQVLREWNDRPGACAGGERCIHELFEEQAERTPGALAMIAEEETLTYAELNMRANRLARFLRRLGVRPETRVGVCLERSLDLVVAVLAILKAGGAYVPLDPDSPDERLHFLLQDALVSIEPPVLVTMSDLAGRFDSVEMETLRIVRLDVDRESLERESPDNLRGAPLADNLAYVIYTSGSTGRPKGVLVTQANVLRLFAATRSRFAFDQRDVWTLFHSYAFDFSVWEIWGALLYGGRLVVVPYWVSRSPDAFHRLLREKGVTVLNQTPSAFRQLVEIDAASPAPGALRLVIFGGEVLELASLAPWIARHGDVRPRLVNMYGITETTVHVTCRPVDATDLAASPGRSPIGGPIQDLRLLLLDRNFQPVPIGVAGEICVGGVGLARGYLGRPDLTALRFVPDPASHEPGQRLYRSGDLASRRPDGDVVYLGRLDHQVKIRGFRVELGEIEAVLGQHPEVRAAAVAVRQEQPGRSLLAAYFVPAGQPAPKPRQLRDFLAERLPAPMVPAAFVELPALPLTPSGKLDRRALPAPTAAVLLAEDTNRAACSPIEASLAAIWAEVIGVERVGIHDNFFELGGDSILSILVVTRAARAGLKITPKQLFEHPTVAQLAAVAEVGSQASAEQGAVSGEVPLTPIQLWFLEQDQPEPHHFNQTVLLEVRLPAEAALLDRAFAAVVAHHDALRLRFSCREQGWRQLNAETESGNVFSLVDLSALRLDEGEGAACAASASLQASLDLPGGPLARAALFRLGREARDRLLVTVHHLAVDAVSWRALLEDLATAYQQAVRGEPIALPAKTTSFKAWAERLAGHAGSDRQQAELDHWLDESWSRPARLPVDFPGGANLAGSFRSLWITLPADETGALMRSAASAYGVQMNEVLLAALGQTLGRWLGSGAVLLDVEGHGREEIFEGVDLSRTVGWFTTIYPLLLRLEALDSPGDALKAVKEQLRRVPGRGIGYGLLRYLAGEETAGRLRGLPQAELAFNYLGQIDHGNDASSLFALSDDIVGGGVSPRTVRRHLIAVDGFIAAGSLQIEWAYSRNLFQPGTMQSLADAFAGRLRALLDHCRSPEAGGYTPSDFGLAELKQQQLDRLAQKYQRKAV